MPPHPDGGGPSFLERTFALDEKIEVVAWLPGAIRTRTT